MEHFITEIQIRQLLHLSNLRISLSPHGRQNLILTGKNGSGKTTLLLALEGFLSFLAHWEGKAEDEHYFWTGIQGMPDELEIMQHEASGEDKQDLYVLIQRELSARSAFTAFKRWLIWDNEEFFTELVALCE